MLCQDFGFTLLSLETIVEAQARKLILEELHAKEQEAAAGESQTEAATTASGDSGSSTRDRSSCKTSPKPTHNQIRQYIEAHLLDTGLVRVAHLHHLCPAHLPRLAHLADSEVVGRVSIAYSQLLLPLPSTVLWRATFQ